jgi:hypothetical protein
MVQCNSDVREEKVRLSKDVYTGIDTGEQLLGEGEHSLRKDTRIFLQTGGDQSRKHVIRQARNSKATHLPHNNTSRHLPCTPCKSYCPSGAEAADYMIKLNMSWYPNTLVGTLGVHINRLRLRLRLIARLTTIAALVRLLRLLRLLRVVTLTRRRP